MSLINEIGRGTIAVEKAQIALTNPLRSSVVILIGVGCAIGVGEPLATLPLAFGALFVQMDDPGGPFSRRATVMLWASVWMALATLVGGLVSNDFATHFVIAIPIAFVCAYASAAGPRASLTGVLCLVCFSIFSGTPIELLDSFTNAELLLLGGLLQTLVTISPWPLRRANGIRSDFAIFFRGLAHACSTSNLEIISSSHATRLQLAIDDLAVYENDSKGELWFKRLADNGREVRFGLLGLAATRDEISNPTSRKIMDDLIYSVGDVFQSIALTLVWHWRRQRLLAARERLLIIEGKARARAQEIDPSLIDAVIVPLLALAETAAGPWPLGRASGIHFFDSRRKPLGPMLRAHWRRNDVFFLHAVRLTLSFLVAVSLAQLLDLPHSYWMPMTVAWISKPDLSGTTMRIVSRIFGTLLGVFLIGLAFSIFVPNDLGLALIIGFGGFVVLVFLFSNYALAVTGITIFALTLFELIGDPVNETIGMRIVSTVTAGVIVFIAAVLIPNRSGSKVELVLSEMVNDLDNYSNKILRSIDDRNGELSSDRKNLLRQRDLAAAAITAATYEVGHHSMRPADATYLFNILNSATAWCVAAEIAHTSAINIAAHNQISREVAELRARLLSIHNNEAHLDRGHSSKVDHPFHQLIRNAHLILDKDI